MIIVAIIVISLTAVFAPFTYLALMFMRAITTGRFPPNDSKTAIVRAIAPIRFWFLEAALGCAVATLGFIGGVLISAILTAKT